jgi:hypothetical protein
MIARDLEGCGSLAAVLGRKSTPFHGADGADALQGIGQQWRPLLTSSICKRRCQIGGDPFGKS